MRTNKKASGSVAIFFALVGLLLFFYLLFLTPDEREEVLSEINTDQKELLTQSYTFRDFHIYTDTQDTLLKEGKNIRVQSSLWSTEKQEVNFKVPSKTQYLRIGLTEENHNANLILKLNNKTLLNQEFDNHYTLIIENFEENNILEILSQKRPLWKIFGRNYYDFSKVQIFGRTVLNDYSIETKTFEITKEKDKIQTARLSYTVTCNIENSPRTELIIEINNNIIKQEQPSCDEIYNYEINKRNLYSGFNELTFSTEIQGDYNISSPQIKTEYYKR